jgi:hypothetical protein
MPLNQPTAAMPLRGSCAYLVGNVLPLARLKLPHSRSEVRHRTADNEIALVSSQCHGDAKLLHLPRVDGPRKLCLEPNELPLVVPHHLLELPHAVASD